MLSLLIVLLFVALNLSQNIEPIGSFDDFNPDTYIATGWAYQNDTNSNGKSPINITIILNETITLITTLANKYYLINSSMNIDPNHGFTIDLSSFINKYFIWNCRLDIYGLDRNNNINKYILTNSPKLSDSMSYNLLYPRQVQGITDEIYSDYLFQHGQIKTLQQRYNAELNDINIGTRRYNFNWASIEPNPPSPNISSLPCNSTNDNYIIVPLNEQDRINRGYNNYHCYSKSVMKKYDTFLSLDKSIDVVSGAIMYYSPPWARYHGCTGFPWHGSDYKYGCVPREDAMNDWMDFCNFIGERYNGSNTTNLNKLSYFVMWNEVGSAGWMDYSPILPNRYNSSNPINSTQIEMWQKKYVDIFTFCRNGLHERSRRGMLPFVSTDHFWDMPQNQTNGNTLLIGEKLIIDGMWKYIGIDIDWSIAVHPYDNGDPENNLWDKKSIYTFDTLYHVIEYQQEQLKNVVNVNENGWNNRPQQILWASEQGWPYNNQTMNDTLRARNICFAQNLSLELGQQMISVTHNHFQNSPTSGNSFGLLPISIDATLSNATGYPTYEAYVSTNANIWAKNNDNYCCKNWNVGCKITVTS
eukprot:29622_1